MNEPTMELGFDGFIRIYTDFISFLSVKIYLICFIRGLICTGFLAKLSVLGLKTSERPFHFYIFNIIFYPFFRNHFKTRLFIKTQSRRAGIAPKVFDIIFNGFFNNTIQ